MSLIKNYLQKIKKIKERGIKNNLGKWLIERDSRFINKELEYEALKELQIMKKQN